MPRINPHYRNLMKTGRSCLFKGPWLQVPLAGESRWINLEFGSKDEAKRCGKTLVVVLREGVGHGLIESDTDYNARITMWLMQVAERSKQYQEHKREEEADGEEGTQVGDSTASSEGSTVSDGTDAEAGGECVDSGIGLRTT